MHRTRNAPFSTDYQSLQGAIALHYGSTAVAHGQFDRFSAPLVLTHYCVLLFNYSTIHYLFMKSLLKFLPALFIAGVCCSCGSSSSNNEAESVQYLPVKLSSSSNWSLMGPDGKIIYEDEFSNAPSMVIENHFSVREGENGLSLYAVADKQPRLVPDCEGLKYCGYMSEGLVPIVHPHERIQFIDKNGLKKFELTPVHDKEIIACADGFNDGMLYIKDEDGNIGFINTKGEVVIEPKYSNTGNFSEGLALVGMQNEDEDDGNYQILIIDKKGETKFKFKDGWYGISNAFKDGFIVVRDDNDRVLFVDTKGEAEKCPARVKAIGDYNDRIYTFYDGDNWGVADRKSHEVLIRARYNSIGILPDGNLLCQNENSKYSVRNVENDVVIDFEDFDRVAYFSSKFNFIARDNRYYVMLDAKGQPVKDAEFYDANLGLTCRTAGSSIQSDYFNMDGMATTIAGLYGDNGIDQYTLGKTPSELLSGPSNYTYRTSADVMEGSGYRWEYTVKAYFDGYIADYSYNYGYFNYSRNYYWNSGTRLETIDVSVEAESELGKAAVDAVARAFKAKGYTEEVSGSNDDFTLALLRKGDFSVRITSTEGSTSLYVEGKKYSTSVLRDAQGILNLEGTDDGVMDDAGEEVYEEVVAAEVAE